MGVEYAHYLIPADNTYRPGPEALSRLISALIDGGFLAEANPEASGSEGCEAGADERAALETGCYANLGRQGYAPLPCPCPAGVIAALGDRDCKLVWPVVSSNESGLKYPLVPFPGWGDAYYDLEFHLAGDYVYHTSELIDPFDRVTCRCGLPLEFRVEDDWNDADSGRYPVYPEARIHRQCPSCGNPFRPQELTARVRDGYTGEAMDRPGGVTYLFAIVVDCGKGFAREGWPIRASPPFLDLVTGTLGREFYQVGDIY